MYVPHEVVVKMKYTSIFKSGSSYYNSTRSIRQRTLAERTPQIQKNVPHFK